MGDTMNNVPRTTMRTRINTTGSAGGARPAAGATPSLAPSSAPSQPTPHDRRRHRAAVAAHVLAIAPDTAAVVEWSDLDAAPAWLAQSESDLATLQRRLGALMHAGDIRLWIDKARLSGARAALGESFLQALLAQRDIDMPAVGAAAVQRIDSDHDVRAALQAAGSVVLLASLPAGTLRRALSAALDPTAAATTMNAELAHSLIARALTLTMGRTGGKDGTR